MPSNILRRKCGCIFVVINSLPAMVVVVVVVVVMVVVVVVVVINSLSVLSKKNTLKRTERNRWSSLNCLFCRKITSENAEKETFGGGIVVVVGAGVVAGLNQWQGFTKCHCTLSRSSIIPTSHLDYQTRETFNLPISRRPSSWL